MSQSCLSPRKSQAQEPACIKTSIRMEMAKLLLPSEYEKSPQMSDFVAQLSALFGEVVGPLGIGDYLVDVQLLGWS